LPLPKEKTRWPVTYKRGKCSEWFERKKQQQQIKQNKRTSGSLLVTTEQHLKLSNQRIKKKSSLSQFSIPSGDNELKTRET